MRIVRLPSSSSEPRRGPRFARLEGDRAHLLEGAPWESARDTGETVPAPEQLLAPIAPTKIVAIGRNYAAHAKELGHEVPKEPLLFLKPPSAIIGPGETVLRPADSQRVEHEAELGVVIGKRARHVAEANAMEHVFGYTILCDVTARDLQRKDVQFTRGKGYDTFCPAGPWIETELDPRDVEVICRVNGQLRQRGHTRDLLFPIPHLIAYVSRVMTLEPGDVISTGTPEGVGPLVAGDVLEIEIPGIGTLRNPIADDVRSGSAA
jgi:2-keto-4-pentenoate hydratase/2-oxohepta-3-ene-1,7-dioic acid hydratase in catechol pathway